MAKTQNPVVQKTQLEVVKEQLTQVRSKMQQAKLDHENNIFRARQLRDLLTKAEKVVMGCEYETLANDEAALMAKLNALETQEDYKITRNQVAQGSK